MLTTPLPPHLTSMPRPQVLPESVDIKAMATATFRVAFRPPRDAVHYCQTLVLYAHIKSMRNFRLLTDAQVVPPWSVPVVATGNTFLHVNPEFSPKVGGGCYYVPLVPLCSH